MSHAHRRMHRRWVTKRYPRGGFHLYATRQWAKAVRDYMGIDPSAKRWQKPEARRQWRARHRRMLNRALAKAQDWRSTVRQGDGEPLTFHGIPIKQTDTFFNL